MKIFLDERNLILCLKKNFNTHNENIEIVKKK